MITNQDLKNKAMPFAAVNIAHEFIHVLVCKMYGKRNKNSDKMTPEMIKYKVKVK